MAVKRVLLGQVWRNDDSQQTYLVTKLYNELFTSYAMLRTTDGVDVLRVKIDREDAMATIPGFTYTQDERD